MVFCIPTRTFQKFTKNVAHQQKNVFFTTIFNLRHLNYPNRVPNFLQWAEYVEVDA